MDGVVALDVERAHGVIGELDSSMHALVAEPAAQLVDGQAEPLTSIDFLDIPEQVVCTGSLIGTRLVVRTWMARIACSLSRGSLARISPIAMFATSEVKQVGFLKVVCLE